MGQGSPYAKCCGTSAQDDKNAESSDVLHQFALGEDSPLFNCGPLGLPDEGGHLGQTSTKSPRSPRKSPRSPKSGPKKKATMKSAAKKTAGKKESPSLVKANAVKSECAEETCQQVVPESKHLPVRDSEDCTVKQLADTTVGSVPPQTKLHLQIDAWQNGRFTVVKKLCDAPRNLGSVQLVHDVEDNSLLAVKQMPNSWMGEHPKDFELLHPTETENPWQDVLTTCFLNSVDYPYANKLLGVYRDSFHTYVASSFATEGDLHSYCQQGVTPGPEREAYFAPLAVQMFNAIKHLHDLQIAHRDISLENILITQEESVPGVFNKRIRIIDYGMSSTSRTFRRSPRGKPSYQAPEMHRDQDCDGFLTDVFALGVVLYSMLLVVLPWQSTKPGHCKRFAHAEKLGFRTHCATRMLKTLQMKVVDCLTGDLMQLLEGMFAFDPAQRLTLGESQWPDDRRSLWDEPWVKMSVNGNASETNQILNQPRERVCLESSTNATPRIADHRLRLQSPTLSSLGIHDDTDTGTDVMTPRRQSRKAPSDCLRNKSGYPQGNHSSVSPSGGAVRFRRRTPSPDHRPMRQCENRRHQKDSKDHGEDSDVTDSPPRIRRGV